MTYRPPLHWRSAPRVWWRWHRWDLALVVGLAALCGPPAAFGLWVLVVTAIARVRAGW